MTRGLWLIKSCLVTLTFSLIMGGWAIFARQDGRRLAAREERRVLVASNGTGLLFDLPPIPPLVPSARAGLNIPNSPAAGPLDLPPIPRVSLPSPLPPIPAVTAPARALRPIARTRSSR
jgi:hypothetical protein